jgi:phosphoserine phosphatase RsbU/P
MLSSAKRVVRPENPSAVISAVNRQLHACSPVDRYATLFYDVFDENTRTLHYANAGHNPAVIRRGGAVAWLEASARQSGFLPKPSIARRVQLYPGDLILAYTDGLVEATKTAGEEWSVEGLLGAVKRCRARQPEGIIEAVFAAFDEFSGNNQIDDATVLAVVVH